MFFVVFIFFILTPTSQMTIFEKQSLEKIFLDLTKKYRKLKLNGFHMDHPTALEVKKI